MRSRGLVVALAVLLAVAAAGAVVLYTNGVKKAAESGGSLTTVIVATQDIPANTSLDTLIESGGFKELSVPADAVVDGAVTSLAELRGQSTTAPIVANEQLTASNLSSGEQVEGGMLGISKGHLALTIKLSAPQGVNGNIQPGDNITVFATYTGASILKGVTIPELVNGTATTTDRQELPDFTVALIPTVRVLQVVNPGIDEAGNQTGDSVTLTLDLLPTDAQALTLANQTATLYIGLLPPGEDGHVIPAATLPVKLLLGKLAI
ncbi:MAG: RcpC/CpaB family pilus assembly protein [Actinomycetota bacterium]